MEQATFTFLKCFVHVRNQDKITLKSRTVTTLRHNRENTPG